MNRTNPPKTASLIEDDKARVASTWALTIAFGVAALFVIGSLWVPLLLAVWTGGLLTPLFERLTRALGGRERAATVATIVLFLGLAIPVTAVITAVSAAAFDLGLQIFESLRTRGDLKDTLSGLSSPMHFFEVHKSQALALAREHGVRAWTVLGTVAGTAGKAALDVFVYVVGLYTYFDSGDEAYDWFEARIPLAPGHLARLAAAVHETGRGLLFGVAATGLVQGLIATIAYFALQVPHALVLGFLTCIASVIPSVGTALVWLPLSLGLMATGRATAGVVLALIGALGIGTIDNILRPLFARYGRLRLPTFTLIVSMLGGILVAGGIGVLLGPLLVRLAVECLDILKGSTRQDGRQDGGEPRPSP